MKHVKLSLMTTLAAASMVAAGSARSLNTADLPHEKVQGPVTYLTGGIGHDEATAMKQEESRYPLALEFVEHAKPKDQYLANVDVTIKDRTGKTALKTISEGPFLFAKLPPGRYTVIAMEDGKARTRHLSIAAHKPEHVVFAW